MEKIVQNLTKIASSLDSQKRIKLASQIDKFADALVQIKTAQYVGVQGYWIRNERCWSNCYRQKRAETPKKASQVVWQECQNEYVESINNPTSGWEKYAQDEKQMKFSKADQKVIKAEQDYFKKIVAEKVENGMFPTVAVYDTIEQRKAEYVKDQIKLANSMLQFAEDMGQKGFKKEAKSLAAEASELIKEAGFFNDMWSGMQGEGKVYQMAIEVFKNNISALNHLLQQYQSNPQLGFQKRNLFKNQLQTTIKNLQGFVGKAKGIDRVTSSGVWQLTRDFMRDVIPIATAMSSATDETMFSQSVNDGLSALANFEQEVPEKLAKPEKQPYQNNTPMMGEMPDQQPTQQPTQQQPTEGQQQTEGQEQKLNNVTVHKALVNAFQPILPLLTDYIKAVPSPTGAQSQIKGSITTILKDLFEQNSDGMAAAAPAQPAWTDQHTSSIGAQQGSGNFTSSIGEVAAKSYFRLVK
jgi:hypothetical protein